LIGNLVTAITLTHSAVATQAHIIRVEYGTEDSGERDVDVYDSQYSFTAPNGKEFSGWIQMPDNPLEDSTGRLETGVVQTGDTYIPDPTHPIPFAIEYDPANPNNSRAVVIGDKQLIPTTGQTVLVGLFVVL